MAYLSALQLDATKSSSMCQRLINLHLIVLVSLLVYLDMCTIKYSNSTTLSTRADQASLRLCLWASCKLLVNVLLCDVNNRRICRAYQTVVALSAVEVDMLVTLNTGRIHFERFEQKSKINATCTRFGYETPKDNCAGYETPKDNCAAVVVRHDACDIAETHGRCSNG